MNDHYGYLKSSGLIKEVSKTKGMGGGKAAKGYTGSAGKNPAMKSAAVASEFPKESKTPDANMKKSRETPKENNRGVTCIAVNHPHKGTDHTKQGPAGPRDGWTRTSDRAKPQFEPENEGAAHAAKRKTADTANIEGNESAMYEKLEKKSLKGLKGGGTEKELREGHNTKGGKMEKTMHEFKSGNLHSGSKKGPKVTNRKQAIAIGMSQARKAGEKA